MPAPAAPKPGLLSMLKSLVFGEPGTEQPKPEPAQARKPEARRERSDGRQGNPRQAGQQNKPKQNRPERTEEEKKRLDEQRKLEQQKRREEQLKREAERKEAQRAESQRKEASKRAQPDAESVGRTVAAIVETALDENADAVSALVIEAGEDAPQSVDALNENGSKRRRGRRGGRRRRQEGDNPESADNASLSENDQSELDFDDSEEQEDIVISFEQEEPASADLFTVENGKPDSEQAAARQPRPARAAPRAAPVVVSAIPVSFAESDFSDLGETDMLEADVAPVLAPAAVPVPEQLDAQETETASAETDEAEPEKQKKEVEPEELPAAPAQITAVEFVEPKPQQTGYVPVAPPSFSMPNVPSSGFDFTVRISPDNKSD